MERLRPMDCSRFITRLYEHTGGSVRTACFLSELLPGGDLAKAAEIAQTCMDRGQVEFHPGPEGGDGSVRLTVRGLDEAWRLADPWYWRWTWNDKYVAAAIALILGVVLNALILLIRWLTGFWFM